MVSFVVFFIGHMTLVALTGFAANLNDSTLGTNDNNLNGFAIWALVIAGVIGFNVWAVRWSWTRTRLLQTISNRTVGRVMDLLFDHRAPRVEYRPSDISPCLWPNHARMPESPEWCALRDWEFRGYRLKGGREHSSRRPHRRRARRPTRCRRSANTHPGPAGSRTRSETAAALVVERQHL